MRFEIKHRFSGAVLFSVETESLKLAVELAVKSGAYLSGADLSGAYLSGADLSGAYLSGANLSRAYLSGAYLSGADLSGADLSRADLSRAYLSGADLSGADLSRAGLSRAYLSDADLSRAKGVNKYVCTPLLMLLDQPGQIIAYKLVTANYVGPYKGGIKYEIGKRVEVEDADTNENYQCSRGISVATLDWCIQQWREGYHILRVQFTAKDIAAIPTATDGKFRLHRCMVLDEVDLVQIGVVK